MIFNYGSGSVSAGSWKFTTATAKPATVAKRTMLAICATAPTTITVADTAPTDPAPVANDVWFHIVNPEDGRAMSDGSVPVKCFGAYQYVDGVWILLTAYYSYLGTWWELPGLPALGTALADCTWDQIDRIGAAGKAEHYFCVGDEKTVTLSTSEVITLQIIDFAHDDLSAAGGGKAPITFGMKDCLNTKQKLNPSNTTIGGWSGSAFYTTLANTIFGTLPEELRDVAKTVNKLTSSGGGSATIATTADKIFLLSDIEVHGSRTGSYAGEGTQYALYTTGGSKIKRVNGVASGYWLRSPNNTTTNCFCANGSDGAASLAVASLENGISFGLCV